MKFLLPPLGLPLCLPAKNNFPSSKSFLALNSLLSVPMTLSEFTPPPVSGFQSAGTSNPTAVQFYVRLRFSSLVSAPAGQHVGSFQSLTALLSLSLICWARWSPPSLPTSSQKCTGICRLADAISFAPIKNITWLTHGLSCRDRHFYCLLDVHFLSLLTMTPFKEQKL